MNRNDMPFLGVHDLFGTALIVPLHIYTGDGALFLNISYHRFFPDYLERGMADSNSIPFLYLYTNRRGCGAYRQRFLNYGKI